MSLTEKEAKEILASGQISGDIDIVDIKMAETYLKLIEKVQVLEDACRAIIKHQEIVGGRSLAQYSTTLRIAERALEKWESIK